MFFLVSYNEGPILSCSRKDKSLLLCLFFEVILDLSLELIRDHLQVLLVALQDTSGQGALLIDLVYVLVVFVEVSVNVGQLSPHGMEDGFGGCRVPPLAARTGKDVGVGLALDQKHNFVSSPAHTDDFGRLASVGSVVDQSGSVALGRADNPLVGVRQSPLDSDDAGADNAEEISALLQTLVLVCLLYTSPSPRDRQKSRMPSSA